MFKHKARLYNIAEIYFIEINHKYIIKYRPKFGTRSEKKYKNNLAIRVILQC